MSKSSPRISPSLPDIVYIVLSQIARLRSEGALSEAEAENKVTRLVREELNPRGLKLLRDELPGGGWRFLIQAQATGDICGTVESGAAAA